MIPGRTRQTQAIEVGTWEDKVGFTLTFDGGEREHFLFSRAVFRTLALKMLHVIDRSERPEPPGDNIGISDSSDVRIS